MQDTRYELRLTEKGNFYTIKILLRRLENGRKDINERE